MTSERESSDGTNVPAPTPAAPGVARPPEAPRPRPSRPGAVPPPVPSRPRPPPAPGVVASQEGALPAASTAETGPWRPTVRSGGVTDVGKLRKHNEDHLLVRPDVGLFVVADGMGGHNAGDVASRLATTSINNFFDATRTGPVPGDPTSQDEGLSSDARRVTAAVRKANSDVHEISSTHRQHRGMGSTVVALYVPRASGFVHVAHVGDSRCYRFRAGVLEQLTRDHSLINDALELKPDLTPAELARLPKNIITRALGMKDAVAVDVRSEPLRPGDTFLLCSDGLTGPVKDAQIRDVLAAGGDVHAMCVKLVGLANDGGGNDNISAVVIRADAEDVEVELVEVDALLSSAPPPDPKVATAPVRPPPRPPARPAAGSATEPVTEVVRAARPEVFAGEGPTRPERPPSRVAALPRPAEPSPMPPPSVRKLETPAALPPVARAALPAALSVDFDDELDVDPTGLAIPTREAPSPAALAPRPPPVELAPPESSASATDRLARYRVARCRECDAELLVGNSFCVECGTRIG